MALSRQQCFAGSAAAHAALLGLLCLAPSFKREEPPGRNLEMVSLTAPLTDDGRANNGAPANPAAIPAPVNPPALRPQPAATVPDAAPQPPPTPPRVARPAPAVEPVQDPPKDKRKETDTDESEPAPAPRGVSHPHPAIDTSGDVRRVAAAAEDPGDRAERAEARKARQRQYLQNQRDIAARLGQAASGIQSHTGEAVSITLPAGSSGPAFADYLLYLTKLYQETWQANSPHGAPPDAPEARARVVVGRNGRVISWEVIRPSGVRSIDAAVERLLRRVDKVRPFPDGATEDSRTFTIVFHVDTEASL